MNLCSRSTVCSHSWQICKLNLLLWWWSDLKPQSEGIQNPYPEGSKFGQCVHIGSITNSGLLASKLPCDKASRQQRPSSLPLLSSFAVVSLLWPFSFSADNLFPVPPNSDISAAAAATPEDCLPSPLNGLCRLEVQLLEIALCSTWFGIITSSYNDPASFILHIVDDDVADSLSDALTEHLSAHTERWSLAALSALVFSLERFATLACK